ncbi:hypothetical protein EDC15_101140 [Acetobacter aceti NBRC 14818]|nr:hypothetical protein EDC15_101140 [Acetobacter aceti NBRC 14818]
MQNCIRKRNRCIVYTSFTAMVRTKERLYTITCLASVFSAFAFLPEAQAASPAKHYKSAKNAATSGPSISSHAVHTPAKAYAKGTEEIKVTRSRQSLNGGGGMMRVETAPHTVQTVTKQFISMRSPIQHGTGSRQECSQPECLDT